MIFLCHLPSSFLLPPPPPPPPLSPSSSASSPLLRPSYDIAQMQYKLAVPINDDGQLMSFSLRRPVRPMT